MTTPTNLQKAIVKQVLSGDTIVVRDAPKSGPPPEKTIVLTNIEAPKPGRRALANVEGSSDLKDDPCGWMSREFLRRRIIGKVVYFSTVPSKNPTTREYGYVYLKTTGDEMENLAETMVQEGMAEVRKGTVRQSEEITRINQLEEQAKKAAKGMWAENAKSCIRDITWNVDNLKVFVDQHLGKPVDFMIENVRDGSTVRGFVLPTFHYISVMLTGIKAPQAKPGEGSEPFAEEAKFFTESRLMQRDNVKLVMEGVSNQFVLGTLLHPNGNISMLLLQDGLARCIDWSMASLTENKDAYRQTERAAKAKKLKIWKEYVAPVILDKKEFSAKVIEISGADSLVVRLDDKTEQKVFLSSVRPPRIAKDEEAAAVLPKDGRKPKPLYQIPYMFEAREYLRTKLIGKKVNITLDYVKPASAGFPERSMVTVMLGDVNIAEAIISRGLCTVLRHRQDDDQRSSKYDSLVSAESKAVKNGKGIHSKKEPVPLRVADLTIDSTKARQFKPFLDRAGKCQAVVEYVASGSRFRLYVPSQTCLLTFLLAGVSCPRVKAVTPDGKVISENEPFGEEAFTFSKDSTLQHEVEFEVDSQDKGGNFIGYLFVGGLNLSVALVELGLARMHPTADRSKYYNDLRRAEDNARSKKLGIWTVIKEEVVEVAQPDEPERKISSKKVLITESFQGCTFWAQHIDKAASFEALLQKMRHDIQDNPVLPGSYTPKRGDLCAAKFDDGLWYRARVEKVSPNNDVSVLFLDYGNRAIVPSTDTTPFSGEFASLPPMAKEYQLAFLTLPKDEDYLHDLVDRLTALSLGKTLELNVEYRIGSMECVTLVNSESREDLLKTLLDEGLCTLAWRREQKFQKLLAEYQKAQDTARSSRRNLWRYGDPTEDDYPEHGL